MKSRCGTGRYTPRAGRLSLILLVGIAFQAVAEEPPPASRITHDGDFKQHLTWSPDGGKFLFTRIHQGKMQLWTVPVAGGEPALLLADEQRPHFDGSWAADSTQIIYVQDIPQGTDGKLNLHAVTLADGKVRVVVPNQAFEESPRWSPDQRTLCFVSTRDGNQEIYLADADGTNVRRRTNEITGDYCPAWSPDGKWLAFATGRYGALEIAVMPADEGPVRRITDNTRMDYWPVWSPDGQWIAATSNRDGNFEIYLLAAEGPEQINLTRHPAQENYAAWSPDGRRLAFISDRDGGHDIYVLDLGQLPTHDKQRLGLESATEN